MTKIEALRKTVYNLENDILPYEWSDFESCNCGVVAKTLLNGEGVQKNGYLDSEIRNEDLTPFCEYAYCITSNMSLPKVFQLLKDAGFTIKELVELENLSNPKISNSIGDKLFPHGVKDLLISYYRNEKSYLIAYLRAWIAILETELSPAVKETIRYVAVPETVADQVKIMLVDAGN